MYIYQQKIWKDNFLKQKLICNFKELTFLVPKEQI